ncbi:NAD(P)H-dependent flavin oxidoreductase [Paenibacillus cremeus]|uniref:Probable nitronate monooxygenase n=1 Tax=Paenibacillus cremeus TaxID=2163881 RepID=A0A559JW11_9BACL|nr:DUF561 domain-containing protein [Paenibacillus cremeus]TVY04017.1 DUF561 domain-containing protein [Paenibacillus cremeus]
MWITKFTEQLGIKYPIIQAPMAGSTKPELVSAISNAGGLGSFGAGSSDAKMIRSAIRKIREQTNNPFAVNLFIPEKAVNGLDHVNQINSLMNLYRQELRILPPSDDTQIPVQSIDEQIEVIIEEKVPVISFTFGYLDPTRVHELKRNGVIVIGTATTVQEAVYLEQCGVNMIVGQGSEAGGHRATFLGEFNSSLIGTLALIPQIVDSVNIPVISAGGIMDGRGIAAALALGASGVQMGTAFLTSKESGAHEKHKEAILNSTEEQSVVTRTFSGKPARGIRNKFITEMERYNDIIPGYPIQGELTKDIRKAASEQNDIEFMSLWAGQASRLSRCLPAKEIFDSLITQTESIIKNLNKYS